MRKSWINEVEMKFYTVRYAVGKNREFVTEVIEFFATKKEAHDFIAYDSFSKNPNDYVIRHEPLKVSIKLI
jgi:hypothetical protein